MPDARWLKLVCLCLLALPSERGLGQESQLIGKKLIRLASETNSRMFQTTLDGASSWADAETRLPAKFAAWQETGFDGLAISIASNDPGKGFANMGAQWWNVGVTRRYGEFTDEIAALTAQDWGRLNDNFLHSSMAPWDSPGRVVSQDWFNNAQWKTLTNNVAVQARVARELGFKGIVLDTEQYDHHGAEPWYHPFDYHAYANGGHLHGSSEMKSFAKVADKVFQRGQEYAQAINSEFPYITLMMIPVMHRPNGLLRQESLYQYFFDGIVHGLDAGSKLIAGSEFTYDKSSHTDFTTIRNETLDQYLGRSTVDDDIGIRWSFAPGVFADHPNGGTWSTTHANLNFRNPQQHKDATRHAMAAADEYAWSYGEQSLFLAESPTPLIRKYLAGHDHPSPPVPPSSDGNFFFDTFDGTGPSGGKGTTTSNFGNGHFFHEPAGQRLQFTVTEATAEQEWRAEPDNILPATANYIVEVRWIVDRINGENATLINGSQISPGEAGALLRIEAKPATSGNNKWQAEISDSGTGYIGHVGPELDYGASTKLVAHNHGDGLVSLWINDGFMGHYPALPGDLEWFGNLGNNSSHIQQGADMKLEYVSLGTMEHVSFLTTIPEPASMLLLGSAGLVLLGRLPGRAPVAVTMVHRGRGH